MYIGYGTCEVYNVNTIREALSVGYRHFDTAAHYYNEEVVGNAIKASGIPREEIIVSTKLWYSDMGYKSCLRAFEESRKRLQVDYIDNYLIHWPAAEPKYPNWEQVNAETWEALEELYAKKKVRKIGVCNFMPKHLDALRNTCIQIPMIDQIEVHPGFYQKEAIDKCKDNGVIIEGWSPLGTGEILDNNIIGEISRKYEKTCAQICLRWLVQHGINPIVKTVHRDRMIENMDIFDFELSREDMMLLDNLAACGGQCAIVK